MAKQLGIFRNDAERKEAKKVAYDIIRLIFLIIAACRGVKSFTGAASDATQLTDDFFYHSKVFGKD